MALSPLTPMAVRWENAFVDLQPTSRVGADHDTANIYTTMLLVAPAAQQAAFALPCLDAPEQMPMLRVIAESAGEAALFEPADPGRVARDFFGDADETDVTLWTHVVEQASAGVFQSRTPVREGPQLVRFHYPQRVERGADGEFEFRAFSPLASLLLNPSREDVSLSVALPRVPGVVIELGETAAAGLGSRSAFGMAESRVLAERQFIGLLGGDFVRKIRYRYVETDDAQTFMSYASATEVAREI